MKFVGPEWLWKYQQDVIVINQNSHFIMSGTPTPNTPPSSLRKSHSSQKQKSVTIVENLVRTREISTQTVHTKSITTQTKSFKKPLQKLKGNEDVEVVQKKKRGRPRKSADGQSTASQSLIVVNVPQKRRRERSGLDDDDSKTIGERLRKRAAVSNDTPVEKKRGKRGSTLQAKLKEFLDTHPNGKASDENIASSSSAFDASEQFLREIKSQKCEIVVNCAPASRGRPRRLKLRKNLPEAVTTSDTEAATIEGPVEREQAESSHNEESAAEEALHDLVDSIVAQESTTERNNDITEQEAHQQPAVEDGLEASLENSSTTEENSDESETPEVPATANSSHDVEMDELNEQRMETEDTEPESQEESTENRESASDGTNGPSPTQEDPSPAREESEASRSRSNSSADVENTPVENEAESANHKKFDGVLRTSRDFDEHQNFLESDEE